MTIEQGIKIYLDVCCLNRPFDDQTQDKVRLEAEAILLILRHSELKELHWLKSAVVDYEIFQTPNIERRERVKRLAEKANETIRLNDLIIERSREIKSMGFKTYDALHIAYAEQGCVNIFLSTDNKLIRLGARYTEKLRVRIQNPLVWLQEII